MRRIREVLRLREGRGCSQREIQASTGLSKGSVSDYLKRAQAAGITWAVARDMSDAEVECRLFKSVGRNEPPGRIPIDFAWVHREMRKKRVTLQLLCVEDQEAAVVSGDTRLPYQYSQFCDLYAAWKSKLALVMRQLRLPPSAQEAPPLDEQLRAPPRRAQASAQLRRLPSRPRERDASRNRRRHRQD